MRLGNIMTGLLNSTGLTQGGTTTAGGNVSGSGAFGTGMKGMAPRAALGGLEGLRNGTGFASGFMTGLNPNATVGQYMPATANGMVGTTRDLVSKSAAYGNQMQQMEAGEAQQSLETTSQSSLLKKILAGGETVAMITAKSFDASKQMFSQ